MVARTLFRKSYAATHTFALPPRKKAHDRTHDTTRTRSDRGSSARRRTYAPLAASADSWLYGSSLLIRDRGNPGTAAVTRNVELCKSPREHEPPSVLSTLPQTQHECWIQVAHWCMLHVERNTEMNCAPAENLTAAPPIFTGRLQPRPDSGAVPQRMIPPRRDRKI
jgi:hypothetical protein